MLGVENADANVVSDTGLKALVVDGGMDWVFELMRDPLAMTIIWPLLASAVGAGLARLFAGPGMAQPWRRWPSRWDFCLAIW